MDLKPQYVKNLKQEFELIKFFENLQNKPYYFCKNNIQNILYKKDKKFILEISEGIKVKQSNFRFQNIDNEIIQINLLKIKVLNSLIKSSNFYDNTKFEINSFCNNKFNEKEKIFYRLLIPCSKKLNIRYHDFFSANSLISINTYNESIVFAGIEFKIGDFTFQIYHLDNYFIVESIAKIEFDLFDKYTRNVLATFGFFTGFAPMKRGYYFGYEKLNDKFKQFIYVSNFIESYKATSLISLNAYEYYQNKDLEFGFDENRFKNDKRIDNITKKLKPIERKHFEKLLNEINNNQEFSTIIYTYLNISNNNNKMALNIKCASYAVLLEIITNFISENNKEKLYFVKDKRIRKEIREELKNAAQKIFEKYNIEDFENSPIKKNIEKVTDPTNRDKLIKPFDILGIKLSQNEIKIIENRNDFLHGRNLVESLDFSEQSQKLFYISLEFNYLIIALILKYIGYNGIVKNLSKIYLDYLILPELENEKYYKDLQNDNNN